ncbi:MAG: hypothetical protein AB7U05_15110 [Mangrovibacterium sp.]
MAKVACVKKKIGQSYLVWLQNSNLYFQLEEPAWFVFSKLARRYRPETIAVEFGQRYGLSSEESLAFVTEMRDRVEEFNQPPASFENDRSVMDAFQKYVFTPISVHQYQFGTKVVRFSYEKEGLVKYIHPLVEHLEVDGDQRESSSFELFTCEGRVVFRLDGEVKGYWGKADSEYTKGKIFLELINVLHDKSDSDWLMTVHASAITNGRKTMLFSAEPGSGKTTMAAMLQAEGFHLISDDFVPFDKYSMHAYPFPIAMSVKEGAMRLMTSLYPDLEKRPLHDLGPEKQVRYLPVENHKMTMIFPAHELVFIKYDQEVDFRMAKLEPIQAIKMLLDQIWVPPSPENVALLFDRLEQFSFYQLVYSNNRKALDAIKQLFDHD